MLVLSIRGINTVYKQRLYVIVNSESSVSYDIFDSVGNMTHNQRVSGLIPILGECPYEWVADILYLPNDTQNPF